MDIFRPFIPELPADEQESMRRGMGIAAYRLRIGPESLSLGSLSIEMLCPETCPAAADPSE
jgi:hypothetical protein